MDSIISTFHIDWKIIIAQAVNFGIVIAVLYFFAVKPLRKLMDERAQKIEGGLDDAKKNAEVLKNTQAEYEEMLRKARIEVINLSNQGKKEVEVRKAEMIENGKKEVASILENGKKALEVEKIKMVAEAQKEVAALALAAVEKILEEKGK